MGCSMLNESHEVQEKYLRDITLLLNQITDHYIYSYNSEELKQAFLYGEVHYQMLFLITLAPNTITM